MKCTYLTIDLGFPGGSLVKNPPANAGDSGLKEMTTQPSILAWEIWWAEKPGRLQSMELQRVGHNWGTEHNAQPQTLWSTPPNSCHFNGSIQANHEISFSMQIIRSEWLGKYEEGCYGLNSVPTKFIWWSPNSECHGICNLERGPLEGS